ncbi:MAG: RHS repeat protein, partial [Herbaspirillum sp.]|nr:RHS repeat protein [Herbaspirillum sp.]
QDASDSDDPGDVRRPRKIAEKIQGITVSQKYYVYTVDSSGKRTEISEQCAEQSCSYGDPGNLRTVAVIHPYTDGDPGSWQPESIVYPDGRKDSFTYKYGRYMPADDPGSPGSFYSYGYYYKYTDDIRTVTVHGTADSPDGIAGKTTREISIASRLGREYMHEVQVYTGTGYQTAEWTVRLYDDSGHVTDVYRSDGTHSESAWSCCYKDSETDAGGITVHYADYDDIGRVLTRVKEGFGDIPDITTTYTYDAAGRRLTEITGSDGLNSGVSSLYDLSGRITVSTDARGLDTTYDYTDGGKTTVVTYPGGAAQITERYADGRVRSITGTGTVHRFYTYGADSSGDRWTTVRTGSETSL